MHNLLTMPIPVATDLFKLSDMCTVFANELVKRDSAAEELALAGRLSYALMVMVDIYENDLPAHLARHLDPKEVRARLETEWHSELFTLLEHGQGLTQVFLSCTLGSSAKREFVSLLRKLIFHMDIYLKEGANI